MGSAAEGMLALVDIHFIGLAWLGQACHVVLPVPILDNAHYREGDSQWWRNRDPRANKHCQRFANRNRHLGGKAHARCTEVDALAGIGLA